MCTTDGLQTTPVVSNRCSELNGKEEKPPFVSRGLLLLLLCADKYCNHGEKQQLCVRLAAEEGEYDLYQLASWTD